MDENAVPSPTLAGDCHGAPGAIDKNDMPSPTPTREPGLLSQDDNDQPNYTYIYI